MTTVVMEDGRRNTSTESGERNEERGADITILDIEALKSQILEGFIIQISARSKTILNSFTNVVRDTRNAFLVKLL